MGGERDISHTSPFLVAGRSAWTSLLLHPSLEGQAPLRLHPVPDAPKFQNFYDPGFQFDSVHLERGKKKKVCFLSLPSRAVPASNYCVYQFVLLWSVFLIPKRMLRAGPGQWKLASWYQERSLELLFGAPFGACIFLAWADCPSLLPSPQPAHRGDAPWCGRWVVVWWGPWTSLLSSSPSVGKKHPRAASGTEIA